MTTATVPCAALVVDRGPVMGSSKTVHEWTAFTGEVRRWTSRPPAPPAPPTSRRPPDLPPPPTSRPALMPSRGREGLRDRGGGNLGTIKGDCA